MNKHEGSKKTKESNITVEQASKALDVDINYIWGAMNSGRLAYTSHAKNGVMARRIYLDQLIALIKQDPFGVEHLESVKRKAELQNVLVNIKNAKKLLDDLQDKRVEVEKWLAVYQMPRPGTLV